MRLHPKIRAALEATNMKWEIVPGRRHHHIKLEGQLVGILPMNGPDDRGGAGIKNLTCQIKRYARAMTAGSISGAGA